MQSCACFWTSTVFRKYVMALTGLFLCAFLVVHLAGNLLTLIPDGGETFNAFAHFMSTNIVIRLLEVVLFAGFLVHIVQSIVIVWKNRKSRGITYRVQAKAPGVAWSAQNMGLLGAIIFVFLVVHIRDFFVEARFYPERLGRDAQGFVDLYSEVVQAFASLPYVMLYVVAMVVLGAHLWHGFQSAFRSLGIMHIRWTPMIVWSGRLFTVVITGGFILIAVYWYVKQL